MPAKKTTKKVAKLVEKEPEVVEEVVEETSSETPEPEPIVEEKTTNEPVDEFAGVPEPEEEAIKQEYYRNELVIGVENRIMNGRMYKDVRTVQATYLLTTEEYEAEITHK